MPPNAQWDDATSTKLGVALEDTLARPRARRTNVAPAARDTGSLGQNRPLPHAVMTPAAATSSTPAKMLLEVGTSVKLARDGAVNGAAIRPATTLANWPRVMMSSGQNCPTAQPHITPRCRSATAAAYAGWVDGTSA